VRIVPLCAGRRFLPRLALWISCWRARPDGSPNTNTRLNYFAKRAIGHGTFIGFGYLRLSDKAEGQVADGHDR
jgi:hypothetical protein